MGSSNNVKGRGWMRSSNRRGNYPIELPMRYELISGAGGTGSGTTTRMCSREVVFISDKRLPVNGKLRLTVPWPALLPDGIELNLWIVGTVVREDARLVEVEISRSEFRTRAKVHTDASTQPDSKRTRGAGA